MSSVLAEVTPMTILLLVFAAMLLVRASVYFIDKSSIRRAVSREGGEIVSIRWTPFALGALFEGSERNYTVSYIDREGSRRVRQCKTGLLTGVFWRA